MTRDRTNQRPPAWPRLVGLFLGGLLMLTSAVLDATRYAEQVAAHGDGLLTVAKAAVGGLLLGSGLEMIRQRRAARQYLASEPGPV